MTPALRTAMLAAALALAGFAPARAGEPTAAPKDTVYIVRQATAVDSLTLHNVQYQAHKKDPAAAGLLGLLLPGAGCFYAGDPGGGAMLVAATVVAVAASGSNPTLAGSMLLSVAIVSPIAGVVDANSHNAKIRRQLGVALTPTEKRPALALTVNF